MAVLWRESLFFLRKQSPVRAKGGEDVKDYRVFNAAAYLTMYPDLRTAGTDSPAKACQHWVAKGFKEGRQGLPTFRASEYLGLQKDVARAYGDQNLNMAAYHWVTFGIREGRNGVSAPPSGSPPPPIPLVLSSVARWVATPYTGTSGPAQSSATAPVLPAEAQVAEGCESLAGASTPGASPYVFNWRFYIQANDDLLRSGLSTPVAACTHWLSVGLAAGRQAHPGFHSQQYLQRYPDLKTTFGSDYKRAAAHYVSNGLLEGRIGYLENHAEGTPVAQHVQVGTAKGQTAAGPLYVSGSLRTAGAIDSVMFKNVELLNSHDHGRQLQMAAVRPFTGECLNPTEAGAGDDWLDPRKVGASSSKLLSWNQAKSIYASAVEPAYWLHPGERGSSSCSSSGYALNKTPTNEHMRMAKTISVGYTSPAGKAMPNVIDYAGTVSFLDASEQYPQVAGASWTFQLEGPTGYMADEFSQVYSFSPGNQTLTDEVARAKSCPAKTTCEITNPLIFKSAKADIAMGVCTRAAPRELPVRYMLYTYNSPAGRFDSTSKWSIVHRFTQPLVGPSQVNVRSFLPVGTLDEVKAAMTHLYQTGDCAIQP